ncbi:23S rRNA (uracil(1939)-C(5))-methyltransferase RlmD [Palaeococcus sp. (in: euryarchaeotes)]
MSGDFIKVYRTKRRFGRYIAIDFEIVEESPLRVRPRCPHFGKCGGCWWQHIKYKEQLKLKMENFERITGIRAEIKGSPKVWGFRNISNFHIENEIGFRRREAKEIVGIEECPIFSSKTGRYLKALNTFLDDEKVEARYLSVREGKFTGDVMVNLISPEEPRESFADYFPSVISVYWSINREDDSPRGEAHLLRGVKYIEEKIGDVKYLIHPNSFFQTNSYALELLLKAVENFVDGEKILDLYAGVGTFGVFLGKRGFRVDGIEINPLSVEIANKNAKLNDSNASFRAGDVRGLVIGNYDTVIVDPPRKGLKEAAELLNRSGIKHIVYISCNPKAFMLDYRNHLSKYYKIEDALLVDMFPHTSHMEAVIKLRRGT